MKLKDALMCMNATLIQEILCNNDVLSHSTSFSYLEHLRWSNKSWKRYIIVCIKYNISRSMIELNITNVLLFGIFGIRI